MLRDNPAQLEVLALKGSNRALATLLEKRVTADTQL
jgi:hypothetical protein